MKARCFGMWQCQWCGCCLHYSGPGQCDAVWRAAGECYSHVTGQPWHAVITSWHISHTTLLSTFHGTLLIEVEEAFMFSLVRCPSRGEDEQWWSVRFSMVKVWPFLTLPRCGLMLMWLLLTAGTFDTICPWTIQHEQWLFSSKRVTSHRLDCSIVFPSVWGWRNGGRRTRLEAGVNIWLFVIIYIWVKFDIPRKGSWWAPIWPLPRRCPATDCSPRGLIWLLLYHFPHQQITIASLATTIMNILYRHWHTKHKIIPHPSEPGDWPPPPLCHCDVINLHEYQISVF